MAADNFLSDGYEGNGAEVDLGCRIANADKFVGQRGHAASGCLDIVEISLALPQWQFIPHLPQKIREALHRVQGRAKVMGDGGDIGRGGSI